MVAEAIDARFETTIALVVVLGGLLAYIYYVTWKQPEGGASASRRSRESSPRCSRTRLTRFTSIELRRLDRPQERQRGWKMTEPVAAAAQESEASGIANALAQLDARVIDENPASLVEYGSVRPVSNPIQGRRRQRVEEALFVGQKTTDRRQPVREEESTRSGSSPSRPSRIRRSTGRRSTCATERCQAGSRQGRSR